MKKRKFYLALILFLFSFWIRLTFLNPGFFHHDSLLLVKAVESSISSHILQPKLGGRYFYVLIHIPIYLAAKRLGIPLDITFNIFSAFWASLAVAVFFLFLSEFIDNHLISLNAGFLLSLNPVFLFGSTYTKSFCFSFLFLALSLLSLIKARKQNSLKLLFLSVLFFLATLFTRESAVFYLLPLFILFFLWGKREKKTSGIFLGGIALSLILFYITHHQNMLLKAHTQNIKFVGIKLFLIKQAAIDLLKNFNFLSLILIFQGTIYGIRKERKTILFALSWCLPFFAYIFINIYNIQYIIEYLGGFIILQGLGLLFLYRKFRRLIFYLVNFGLCATMFLTVYPLLDFRKNFSGEKEYALWVKTKTEDNAIIIAMDDAVFVEFYAKRKCLAHPIGDKEKIQLWIKQLFSLAKAGHPLYLMGSGLSYDDKGYVKEALSNYFTLRYVGSHLTEDYHRAAIYPRLYYQKLLKLELNNGVTRDR